MTTLLFQDGVRVLTGADSVVNRVARRLRFSRGEWILNPLLGVSYNEVFDSNGELLDDIKANVLEVDGVIDADISIRDFESASRTLHLVCTITTEFGTRTTEIEV